MLKRTLFVVSAAIGFQLLLASDVSAQNVTADRLRFTSGACTITSGPGGANGSPEGAIVGKPCDEYRSWTDQQTYVKVTGVGTTTGWYPKIGASSAPCSTFANCVAASLTLDTTYLKQVLRTDPSFALRQFVNTEGATIEAYSGAGWSPLRIYSAPTQFFAGGVHVGGGDSVSDPGIGNLHIDGFVGKLGFVSQTIGWRIDGLGAAEFRYLFTDELHAKKFIADLEQALAGLQIIAKSVGQIGQAFTVPAAGAAATLVMKDLPSAEGMAVFESGDYVWIRTFSRAGGSLSIGNAYGIVTGYTDLPDKQQSWTFTRLATNGGAMSGGTVVEVDSIVLDVGVPGNGWVETNAVDGLYGINAPYTQVVTWSGNSPISGNQTLRTRLGNLRGITGVTGEYGLIAGTYAASNGQYLRASSQAFELHGINLTIWDGPTRVLELDRTAPSFALGSPLPSAYGSGTGVWMGKDGSAYKFRVGAPGGAGVFWDGTNLNVTGTVTITGGNAAKTDFSNVTAGYAGSATVGGNANDTVTVNGVAASTVQEGAARANLGLNSSGVLVTKVIPASAVAPSGAGLYLGSDYLGYYNGSAWRTYMDNSGNFYLGGSAGPLQWNAGTNVLSVTGAITVTGGNAAKTDLTNVTGNYAGSSSVGGPANDTAAVNGTAASTIATGANRAVLGLNSSGNPTLPNNVAPSGGGLYLGYNYMGYYDGGAWKTYMNNSGHFYLGGTSGALQWNGSTLAVTGNVTVTGGAVVGSLNVSTSGDMRSGATGFTTGTGYWMDYNAGTPRFRIGDPAGNRLLWDGSDLELVTGAVRIDGGSIELSAGTGFSNRYNFTDGSYFTSSSDFAVINGDSRVSIDIAGAERSRQTASLLEIWTTVYAYGTVSVDKLLIDNIGTTTSNDYPAVWSPADTEIRYKTNGIEGTICGGGDVVETITFERGIAVGYSCAPNPTPGVAPRPVMLAKGSK